MRINLTYIMNLFFQRLQFITGHYFFDFIFFCQIITIIHKLLNFFLNALFWTFCRQICKVLKLTRFLLKMVAKFIF